MNTINPHGSRGLKFGEHPIPYEHTEEGIAALAARVPADAELLAAKLRAATDADLESYDPSKPNTFDKAADSVIAEIVPSGTRPTADEVAELPGT